MLLIIAKRYELLWERALHKCKLLLLFLLRQHKHCSLLTKASKSSIITNLWPDQKQRADQHVPSTSASSAYLWREFIPCIHLLARHVMVVTVEDSNFWCSDVYLVRLSGIIKSLFVEYEEHRLPFQTTQPCSEFEIYSRTTKGAKEAIPNPSTLMSLFYKKFILVCPTLPTGSGSRTLSSTRRLRRSLLGHCSVTVVLPVLPMMH